jgi:hypothetical protein
MASAELNFSKTDIVLNVFCFVKNYSFFYGEKSSRLSMQINKNKIITALLCIKCKKKTPFKAE